MSANNAVLNRVDSLHIKGFRSLAEVNLGDLPNPMVLLGPNGAGKSNVLSFFELLKEMYHLRMGDFVLRHGGADDQLFGGSKRTSHVWATVFFRTAFGRNKFTFELSPTGGDGFAVMNEDFHVTQKDGQVLGYGRSYPSESESGFFSHTKRLGDARSKAAARLLGDGQCFQFHDTSAESPIQKRWDVEDNHGLLAHGGNLAPILLRLREMNFPRYRMIRAHIKRMMPEFDDFEVQADYGKTLLRWRPQNTNKTMGAHLTSDGTLRCFCLVTLLNLPDELLPKVILLDEPELGLHPFAISLVSHMVKSLAQRRQVIVATQSPHFVDAFNLNEIVVLNMRNGRTEANRLSEDEFGHWLEEYTTGELWRKNVLGGYP